MPPTPRKPTRATAPKPKAATTRSKPAADTAKPKASTGRAPAKRATTRTASTTADVPAFRANEGTLREVIEQLAPLERRAGSPGEQQAAEWIAERLRQAGCEDAHVETAEFRDGYAKLHAGMHTVGTAAGVLALTKRGRRLGAALGAVVFGAVADDISNGPRVVRKATTPLSTTWNVVATAGDPTADRTFVVLAHHDAAPTGKIFDQSFQRAVINRFHGIAARLDTGPPPWLPSLAGPLFVAFGAAKRKRRLTAAGLALSAGSVAALRDVASSPVVPGASDNLSAVASLVVLAERLKAEPLEGVRVLLVSCGAEEVLQGGIYGFGERWFPQLPRDRTWFLNLETLGGLHLGMVEGEGPVIMEDYIDRTFRELVARAADRADIPLMRGLRSRASTDSIIPNRAGYAIATLVSTDRDKLLEHYHLPEDRPENIRYDTVGRAVVVTEAVARALADAPV
jgi:acetylornithine deacetylase/succinyl-diaminopimelate desuccinylase-like protein